VHDRGDVAADDEGLAQGVLMVQHSGKAGMAQAELKGVLQPPPEEAKGRRARWSCLPRRWTSGRRRGAWR